MNTSIISNKSDKVKSNFMSFCSEEVEEVEEVIEDDDNADNQLEINRDQYRKLSAIKSPSRNKQVNESLLESFIDLDQIKKMCDNFDKMLDVPIIEPIEKHNDYQKYIDDKKNVHLNKINKIKNSKDIKIKSYDKQTNQENKMKFKGKDNEHSHH